jgi:EAL domain-containing protein (putative c-di-GMP-specific phosphodiesterase class I)
MDRAARDVLGELRALGLGVAIDDFGTGYSSFAALQDMPITQLKVDRAFIARLDRPDGSRARAIVQAIVDVSRATGLTCVAEGVETLVQRQIVLDLGCHLIQGHIEARPMPAAAVLDYLAARAG